MKQTKKVTIVHYRRRRIKTRRIASMRFCPTCGREADLISVSTAVHLTGVSQSTIMNWANRSQLHATPLGNGDFDICSRSLLARITAEDPD